MKKNELITKLSKRTGIEEFIVRTIVDTFSDEVSKQLLKGESVHMRGFGTFGVKHCAQKVGRNINKKQVILIPAHDQPTFKPAESLRLAIKEKTKKEIHPKRLILKISRTIKKEPQPSKNATIQGSTEMKKGSL